MQMFNAYSLILQITFGHFSFIKKELILEMEKILRFENIMSFTPSLTMEENGSQRWGGA